MRLVLLDDTQIDAIAEALAASDSCINDSPVNCFTCGNCKACSLSFLKERSVEVEGNEISLLKYSLFSCMARAKTKIERQMYIITATKMKILERIMKL